MMPLLRLQSSRFHIFLQEVKEQQLMKSQIGVIKNQIDQLAQQVHCHAFFDG